MIVGIGLDVCDVHRMKRELARTEAGFRDQVFTSDEIAWCESRRNPAQHYAARFAAKEATFKALGTGARDTGVWHEVEVAIAQDGHRRLLLHGRLEWLAASLRVARAHLTLSHDHNQAIANVVLEAADAAPVPEVHRVAG